MSVHIQRQRPQRVDAYLLTIEPDAGECPYDFRVIAQHGAIGRGAELHRCGADEDAFVQVRSGNTHEQVCAGDRSWCRGRGGAAGGRVPAFRGGIDGIHAHDAAAPRLHRQVSVGPRARWEACSCLQEPAGHAVEVAKRRHSGNCLYRSVREANSALIPT